MVWSTSQAAVGRCNQTAQLLANSVNGERRPRALHPDVVNACPISIESVSVEIIDDAGRRFLNIAPGVGVMAA